MQNPYYYNTAKYAFWALVFFTIWGTDVPFSGGGVVKQTGSSVINQLLYSVLFLTSVICLIPRKAEFFRVIKNEKFLSLFIIFSLMSMIWSDYSFLTFKRIFQILSISLTCITFLFYMNDSSEIIKPFKYILYPYLFLTLVAIIVLPQARSGSLMWRGLTSNKNLLGQIAAISVILCYIFYKVEYSLNGKLIALFMSFLAIVFTVGSNSSTSLLTVLFLFALGVVLSVDAIFKPLRIGRTISFIVITSFFILITTIMVSYPEIIDFIPELFGKDSSFSGRSDLWNYLLTIGSQNINPLFGAGYGAFWVPESERILGVYSVFVWLPLQSHNGFIDTFLATGYVGIALITLIFTTYFINYFNIQKPHPWLLFIIVTLIINFQESSLLKTGTLSNFTFIFAYLLLFVNKYKMFKWCPE